MIQREWYDSALMNDSETYDQIYLPDLGELRELPLGVVQTLHRATQPSQAQETGNSTGVDCQKPGTQ